MEHNRIRQQLETLYDWMQIVNKEKKEKIRYSKHNAFSSFTSTNHPKDDLRQIMKLIHLPFEESEIEVLYSIINPHNQPHTPLTKQQFVDSLVPPEDQTKKNNKLLMDSFKFLSNSQNNISSTQLKEYLKTYSAYPQLTQTIMKELAQFEKDGVIDFKKYCDYLNN